MMWSGDVRGGRSRARRKPHLSLKKKGRKITSLVLQTIKTPFLLLLGTLGIPI
jgi:hypothetical protein